MIDIVAFGDSILKGILYENGIYKISKNRFSDLCERAFGVSIENKGRLGSTIDKGGTTILKNLPSISESKSAYVILEFGGNDCDFNWGEVSDNPNKDHFPKNTLERFSEIYSNLIEKLKNLGKIPTLLSLPPIDHIKYFDYISKKLNGNNILTWLKGNKQFIYNFHERYNVKLFNLAIDNKVPIIDITSKFLGINNYSDFLCVDGIHPNEKGHSLIAESIKEYVEGKKIKF